MFIHDFEGNFLEGLESLTHELDQHILRGESWDELMQFLCRRIVHILPLPLAWVGKRHVAEERLVAVAAASSAEPCLVKLLQINHVDSLPKVTLEPTLAALRSGRPQSASADDPGWKRWASVVEGFRIRAGFAIPLIVRGKVEGVCSLYAERPDQFNNPLIRTRLECLSDHLSLTLERALDQHRMRLLMMPWWPPAIPPSSPTGKERSSGPTSPSST
ncbi:MAG: GAF domain-containing protein [Gammaproteobacteria bacterium]|nr:GAF domain-containing protein [Gammaproteobacteria bacterium]